ncbi:MAG: exo-alpha-sialidase [Chloroflexi bacterium]|nr:exo-alpha-sialidase [Chloroflexota bacterium]
MGSELRQFEHCVAVDNYCAWPNLTVLPDGSVGALIFNQPSHGRVEGDIELWVSADGRPPWIRRSAVTQHLPGTSRFNVAGGLGHDGVVIAVVGGWLRPEQRPIRTDNLLDLWVCRSTDAGHTWEVTETFTPPPGAGKLVPFGNVRVGQDGALYVAAYDCRMSSPEYTSRRSSSYVFRSTDNGRHWPDARLIGRDGFTETDILQTRDGTWLAAARTLQDYAHPENPQNSPWVTLLRADREATSWEHFLPLTLPWQHPGNLLQLQDGRILFTCGSRISGYCGVFVRVSEDQGESWTPPLMLVGDLLIVGRPDCGYPSTVQLADGTLVTAYYAIAAAHHQNYHMAVMRWRLEDLEQRSLWQK